MGTKRKFTSHNSNIEFLQMCFFPTKLNLEKKGQHESLGSFLEQALSKNLGELTLV